MNVWPANIFPDARVRPSPSRRSATINDNMAACWKVSTVVSSLACSIDQDENMPLFDFRVPYEGFLPLSGAGTKLKRKEGRAEENRWP